MEINLKINSRIFNDIYYPYLLNYDNRYEIYYGGAGSGKSHFVFQKIVIKALKDKRKVLIVRKTAKSNENSTFQMAKDTLSHFHLLKNCKINKTTQRITFPNDSIFIFAGLDDVEKLKSIAGITDIVIEEATEITEDDFAQLDLRLRAAARNLQIYLMFNPVSKTNWVYRKWFEAERDYKDTFILHTTYKNNKFLPADYIQAIEEMRTTNPAYYQVYALGEFASLDKLVYNNWTIEAFDHTALDGDLLIGLDWGFVNDKTALIASILDTTANRLYIFDEWGAKGKTNDEIAQVIINKGYSKSIIIADSAEQKSIEEIKRLGVDRVKPSEKGKGSILAGIQKLQACNIIVNPSCVQTIEELQNYSWKKDKNSGEYTNTPIDDYNHFLDALRYSLQCKKGKLRTLNKNSL